MAKSNKKNPINDIIDTVGAWLGGSKGAATNPQVRAAMDATRAIGKVVDTATGGFGQAAVDDARRMAASGSSTPSSLYKTAAVNLAAAAAGAVAGAAVSKGVSRVKSRFAEDIGLHVSKTAGIKNVTYSANRANTGLGDTQGAPLVHGMTYKISGFPADTPLVGYQTIKYGGSKFTNKLFPKNPKLNVGLGRYLDPEAMAGSAFSAGEGPTNWSTYVTKSKTGKLDPEGLNRYDRITPKQDVLAEVRFPGYGKDLSGRFSSQKAYAKQAQEAERAVVREIKKARSQIASRQNELAKKVGTVTAAAAFVAPKKARGGGTKKK